MEPILVGFVVVLAAGFGYLNGFRDASTSVALTVRTRALTPSIAVVLSALFNMAGVVASAWLLTYFGGTFITAPPGPARLTFLAAMLVSAGVWGIYGWWRGYPASSTHALVGGLIGASVAGSLVGDGGAGGLDAVFWSAVGLPLVLSPLLAFGAAFFLTPGLTWIARHTQPSRAHAALRAAQAVGSSIVAFGHGLQDGQRVLSVLVIAALGSATGFAAVPPWAIVLTALAFGLGTLSGGWRITYTLSHRLVRVDPLRGFVSQLVTFSMQFLGALALHWPLSTTHTVTASVLGAGASQDYAAVNGRLVGRLVQFWLLTPLATAVMGFVFALAFSPLADLAR
ncbi:inorganic phosphate transporter [Sinomonas halotolerans]|uniref:Inorganic phosphate transporter n=1 Tax=Sinomonas halotolerans TaxID=1644133 RepID=A0ABU9WXK4_9MICC